MRGLLEGWHPVVLVVVLLVLFGGKRLPDAARGLGRSLRIFKSEIKEMTSEESRGASGSSSASGTSSSAPGPIEGRIVEHDNKRAAAPSEQRHDA
jgi:sec-independent protein translocase protein TatA